MNGPRRAVQASGLLVAVLLLAAVFVGARGVGVQQAPDTVAPSTGTPTATARPPRSGSALVAVYFVRDQRLVEAQRRGSGTVQAALDLLTAGPSSDEVAAGTDSAVAPQSLTLDPRSLGTPTAVVAVGPELAAVAGRRQLLAVGQVVWTVTAVPGVERVQLLLGGQPLATPTDRGLVWSAVGRSDYRSVTPAPPPDLDPSEPPP